MDEQKRKRRLEDMPVDVTHSDAKHRRLEDGLPADRNRSKSRVPAFFSLPALVPSQKMSAQEKQPCSPTSRARRLPKHPLRIRCG
jgi:hypothetical protein